MTETTLQTRELAVVRDELSRIDTKCSALVTVAGAGTALIAALATVKVRGGLATAGFVIAGLLLAAATIMLLLVLRPRLGRTGFRAYADMNDHELRQAFDLNPGGEAALERRELHRLSALVNSKSWWMQLAVDLMIGAAGLLGLALIAGALS